MKKLILICAIVLGISTISVASHGESNSSISSSASYLPTSPTHRAVCVTNPDNPRAGEQETFLFAYDDNNVIWVYGTFNETFSAPIRTASSGRSDFRYKFMAAGKLWFLPA